MGGSSGEQESTSNSSSSSESSPAEEEKANLGGDESSGGGGGEEEEKEAAGGGGFADPESPNSKANSTSSSSEGVLVELPVNADQVQESSSHQDSGILVNIDGSMQENLERDDASREDSFVDAPDDLGFVEERSSSGGLEESMAMIEIGEHSGEKQLMGEVNRLRALLAEALDECGRYKGEQESLGREIGNIQYQLKAMINRQSPVAGGGSKGTLENLPQGEISGDGEDTRELLATMPLHSVLRDCSKLVSHLRVSFDEQLQSEGRIREFRAILDAKDQEIEDLNVKLSEGLVSRDVVASYVESLRESSDAVMKKLLASLASVVQDYEISQDAPVDESTLVEKKTLLLIDRYAWFHYETEQLGQYLYSVGSKFAMPHGVEVSHVFDATRNELLESRTRETYYIEKINELEQEKGEMFGNLDRTNASLKEALSEASKTKLELEQMEQRFVAAKEKLSIAVTKGKSLVQHRDSLKQLLAEKSTELEKCLQELQQKSDALETAGQSITQLNQSRDMVFSLQSMNSEKDNVLHAAEEALSQSDFPEELQSTDIIDRIRWLIDQRKISEGLLLENNKLQHALASFSLPETILSTSLENQINWLGESFAQVKEDLTKTQDEVVNAQAAFESRQSELLQASKEIEHLTELLFVEKQEKDSLHVVNEDLTRKFESMVERLSRLSSEKNGLMRALGELSQCIMNDDTADEVGVFTERCVGKIREKMNLTSEPSSDVTEGLQRLQSLLYDRNLELAFCDKMLEEEMAGLSDQLHRVSEETVALRNERDSLQKDLEHAEDRSSLIREKLSMAVKKGKGLVQEREGFKQSLEEKNSEIDRLKHELKLQKSTVIECNQQITILTADLEQIKKLESDIVSMRDERDQIEQLLLERNSMLQKVIESIEQIGLPSDIAFEGPVERVKWIAQHVFEAEESKTYAEKELERLKEKVTTQVNQLSDASVNIRSLENALSVAEKRITVIFGEKVEAQLGKSSIELELKKVKEEADVQAGELEQSYNTVSSLEEALLNEKKKISLLIDEKNELELKSKQEIMTLNANIAACMEELEGTSGSLENHSAELTNQFRYLLSLTMEDSSLSLATEKYRKNVGGLKNMARLVESIHDQFSAGGLQAHPGSQQDSALVKLRSLPELEEYLNVTPPNTVERTAEVDDTLSFTKVAEGFTAHSKILDDHLTHFSCYIDDHITLLIQVLQEMRDNVVHIFELGESYKQNVNELEASNQAQEVEISSLENDLSILHSACLDAMQVLQINFQEILGLGHSEQAFASSLALDPVEVDVGGSTAKEHIRTAENLLLVAKRIINQIEQFSEAKNIWRGSIDDLENKLQKAELTAESAYQEKNVEHERVSKMEAELKTLQNACSELKSMVEGHQSIEVVWKGKEKELASLQNSLVELKSMVEDYQSREVIWKDKEKELASLQNVCSELKSMEEDYQSREVVWKDKEKEMVSLQNFCSELKFMVEDYQSREVAWKDKEKELASLQHKIALKDREGSEKLALEGQLDTLFEKVNKMKIPSTELEVEGQEPQFSSAMNKILYILNSVDTLKNMMDEMTDEKENLQASLAVHVDEVKHLKMVAENLVCNNQELESRNSDLNELTMRLERILQKSGAIDALEDKKPVDANGLLSVLERLITASRQESESSKLRAQELGAKLFTTQKVADELSAKVKSFEDSLHASSVLPEIKDRGMFESSSSITASEISEVEDVGQLGKSSLSPPPAAALRPMRKGSNDHLILNIDTESERLIGSLETDDKGHVFKSLNTSGLIPKQGKLIADRVDGLWVSGGRILMGRPGARIGLVAYWIILHIWVLGTIL